MLFFCCCQIPDGFRYNNNKCVSSWCEPKFIIIRFAVYLPVDDLFFINKKKIRRMYDFFQKNLMTRIYLTPCILYS